MIENSYFAVGNVLLLQTVGIPMRFDSAPFWANLYLYNYESKYITNLIRTNKLRGRRFHSTFRFIDDLCALNNGGEFGKAFTEIYPTELKLKVKHNGRNATFLDLDISIDKGKFIYKMFEKQDDFNFHIARMPSIKSNIPSIIVYSSTMLEFVRIARSTLILKGCVRKILLVCFVCLKESTCKAKKNAFNFNLKALFVLEIIKF